MAKPQKCPHCKMAIGKNFVFDENLNFICLKCGKVAYPATEKAEEIFSHSLIPMEKQNVNPSNYRHNKKVD